MDDGCFWINWLDVIKWFSHLYVCWTPTNFPHSFEIHSKWQRSSFIEHSILQDDSHLVAFNPQFRLSILDNAAAGGSEEDDNKTTSSSGMVEVWVLLSRHVRERKRDLSQKYLAVHIHTGKIRHTFVCLLRVPQGRIVYIVHPPQSSKEYILMANVR